MRRAAILLCIFGTFLAGVAYFLITSPNNEVASELMDKGNSEITIGDSSEAASPTTFSPLAIQPETLSTFPILTTPTSSETLDETTTSTTVAPIVKLTTTTSLRPTTVTQYRGSTTTKATPTTSSSTNTTTQATTTQRPTTTARQTTTTARQTTTTARATTTTAASRSYVLPSETGTKNTNLVNVGSTAQLYYDITAANTVIDGRNIRGCVRIKANNVTIKNSKITCLISRSAGTTEGAIDIESGRSGILIQSNTIVCSGATGDETNCTAGIRGGGFTARLNDISGGVSGIIIRGSNTIADKNYVHSLRSGRDLWQSTGRSFNIGIRSYGGTNQKIKDNYLTGFSDGDAGVFVQPERASIGGQNLQVEIKDNYIRGTWRNQIFCSDNSSNSFTSNCLITRNLIQNTGSGYAIYTSTSGSSTVSVTCNRWTSQTLIPSSKVLGATNSC